MLARVMTLQCQASIAGQASDLALIAMPGSTSLGLYGGASPARTATLPLPMDASPGFCSHVGWEPVQFWKWLQLVDHYNVAQLSHLFTLR